MTKNTTVIAFHGGCYGTYVEWILTTLTNNNKVLSPFTAAGNSHNYTGNHILDMNGWEQYYKSNLTFDYVRLHPKKYQHESLEENLNKLVNEAKNVIYVYPSKNSMLLAINNQFNKIWDDWWKQQFDSNNIDQSKIYKNWNINKDVDIKNIPDWIKREFLSFYLMPMWFDQVEWFNKHQDNKKWLTVYIDDILFNFNQTVTSMIKYSGNTQIKNLDSITPLHCYNVSLQQNINQDYICKKIIDSVTNEYNYSWSKLTLVSEAFIQWQLRNIGYEIQCDGLDIFPTNSLQLKNLLIPAA